MLNPSPAYAPPTLAAPPTGGYLHIAAAVAPPVGPPFVRRNSSRTALLRRLKQLTGELERLDAVQRVTVYRAVLIPPLGGQTAHPARYDVAVLIETRSPQTLDDVGSAAAYEQLLAAITAAARDVHVMAAGCARSLGEVEQSRGGLFLFNLRAGQPGRGRRDRDARALPAGLTTMGAGPTPPPTPPRRGLV
jgi:hypothetical protein